MFTQLSLEVEQNSETGDKALVGARSEPGNSFMFVYCMGIGKRVPIQYEVFAQLSDEHGTGTKR